MHKETEMGEREDWQRKQQEVGSSQRSETVNLSIVKRRLYWQ